MCLVDHAFHGILDLQFVKQYFVCVHDINPVIITDMDCEAFLGYVADLKLAHQ
jgi:hypothetical protein